MNPPTIRRYSEADVPLVAGLVRVVVYREVATWDAAGADAKEHVALVAGDPRGAEVLTRVHSECWTGEVLHSQKCDCREQLDAALDAIIEAERGVIVYLRQEGRGIGLGNKILAYALQNAGADTVEANERLGFAVDSRSYGIAAEILADLAVESVALMTNNTGKLAGLQAAGVQVARRVPLWVRPQEHNRSYLEVKRAKMGHLE